MRTLYRSGRGAHFALDLVSGLVLWLVRALRRRG